MTKMCNYKSPRNKWHIIWNDSNLALALPTMDWVDFRASLKGHGLNASQLSALYKLQKSGEPDIPWGLLFSHKEQAPATAPAQQEQEAARVHMEQEAAARAQQEEAVARAHLRRRLLLLKYLRRRLLLNKYLRRRLWRTRSQLCESARPPRLLFFETLCLTSTLFIKCPCV
jgi:hypothetical protein